MASETQGVADFTQAVREAAEKLLGPHSLVEMREWSGWETPLPSRFVFHLLGERVPDSIRESADDDQQLICGWLRAAQERARLGRRATPPWMALSSAPAELHRYLRTIGAEKRAALARDASERELRNEDSRRRLAAHTDAAKGRFNRVRALRHKGAAHMAWATSHNQGSLMASQALPLGARVRTNKPMAAAKHHSQRNGC